MRLLILLLLLIKLPDAMGQNRYVDSLYEQLKTHPEEDTNRIIATHKLSYRLSEINASKSWKYARETESLSKKLNFKKGECLANINYAILEAVDGNFQLSADYYLKAIEIARKISFTRGLSIAYNNIGENYFRLKQYDQAIRYTQDALALNQQIGEYRGQAINLEMIGSIHFAEGKYAEALTYWTQGFEFARKSKDPNITSQLYADLGKYYTETNRLEDAFRMLKIADSIATSHQETLYQILVYKALAQAWEKRNQLDSSRTYLHRALQSSKLLGNKNEESDVFALLAAYFEKMRQYDSGMYYLKQHKKLADTLQSDRNIAHLAFIQTKYETELKEQENQRLKGIERSQKAEISQKNKLLLASIVALLLAVLSILLIYWYFKNKKHNLELLELKNNAEYKRQLTELEIKSLRSQMNPHFIFNSLNSIRNYIICNDAGRASNYLAQFASLMRKILDASQQSFIYIDEEVNMLKLYLELELMRFSHQFNYQITIDPEVDASNYKIPTMVIQPFVENAIWHGLLNKETGQAELKIEFGAYPDGDHLIWCEITDNGIGRQKSHEIRDQHKPHKSKGMEITRERLIRLSGGEIQNPIVYTDLMTEEGEPCGTRVRVELPVA